MPSFKFSHFSFLLLVMYVAVLSCSRSAMSDEEASRWIAAYSPSHIDSEAAIRIELTDEAVAKCDTTRSLKGIFSFSPSVKGNAVYSKDKRFVDFIPEKELKQGQNYECRVNMKKLLGVDSLGDFRFDFYIDRRQMRFVDVKASVDPDNTGMMVVSGQLGYNDRSGDSITLQPSFIECDFADAKVIMDAKASNGKRGFRIMDIKRRQNDYTLKLATNSLGGFSAAKCEVEIPSTKGFKLISAERIESAEPYIDLEFSAPLSSQQELDGLISIDNVDNVRIERSGTKVKVYYPRNGMIDMTLHISESVKNGEGQCLDKNIERHFKQEVIAPAVEIPVNGTILPDNGNLRLPFRAVNLAAVDIEVVKIFPSNALAFFHYNDYSGVGQLRRYGRLIYHRTVRLDKDKSVNLHQWQDFAVDLKGLFARERGAIYNIQLSFRKAYSLYDKASAGEIDEITGLTEEDEKTWNRNASYIYRDAPDYDWSEFKWNESNDPSKDSYYMRDDLIEECNLVASNLGLIVKRESDRSLHAIVTDIKDAAPCSGITVTAYNYQLQKIASGTTDSNGFVDIATSTRPYIVTATDGYSTTYLNVSDGNELSTSNFDVSGRDATGGIKGFVYGERGVWRPGDEVHLTLIVEDKDKKLPANHPVVMELYNPTDQLYNRQTLAGGTDGFYVFHIPTGESVPTGRWDAVFKVGNSTFHHPVRIETIKPNRLKVNIKAPKVIRANNPEVIGINAHWLSGPAAKDMAASLEMTLYTDPTPFKAYKKYTFNNPLVSYELSEKALYSGKLDDKGNIMRKCTIGADANSPGMLQANVTAKVTEPGGDASVVSQTVPFSPFGVYVGIDLGEKSFVTDTEIKLPVVALNQEGARMRTRELDYKIYRLDYEWWWEENAYDLSRYVQSSSVDVVANGVVKIKDGHGVVSFKVEYPNYGRYLVVVRDNGAGHATGGVIDIDWPEWRGRAERKNAVASSELTFTLDKKQYEVGETANVFLPRCEGGRVLLSIENGSGIVKKNWVNTSKDKDTKYPLRIDKAMAPNFYVSATLLRPHRTTDFDTPIRLFGIQSARVVNPNSILNPVIEMPDELHPHKSFDIKVREKDNKPMTYTLAVVDEGLIDITNFKTPRPWPAMNLREALGVKTWDMFDEVIGAFGSNFRSVLSIGGDEALRNSAGKEKRFNPVVRFMGPFTLRGGSKTHRITMPNYVGSVRVMVVCAHDGSYGNADKTVKVTSPLMLLSTMPRVLACADTVAMPVNVFAMANDVKEATVSVDVSGPLSIVGAKNRSVTFNQQGEKLVNFSLVCDKSKTGKARIITKAVGNGHSAADTIFIDVRNPMPNVVETEEKVLPAGRSVEFSWQPVDNGQVSLQIASMPAINFNGVAAFMEHYPHMCTEQLSSKALFMLYGRDFLDSDKRNWCEKELPSLIRAVQFRQLPGGGFAYWPGDPNENEWVTTMAGIVLNEAMRQGFRVDKDCLERWRKFEQGKAREYKRSPSTESGQAFRLYALAQSGEASAPAMNRLRESKELSQSAALLLACAYNETGRKDVAEKLLERAERSRLTPSGDWFHSPIRDKAIEVEAYAICGNVTKAIQEARQLSSACNGTNYVTQDLAFASMAFKHLANLVGTGENSVVVDEKGRTSLSLAGFANLKDIALGVNSGHVKISNQVKNTLDLSLLKTYQPRADAPVSGRLSGGINLMVSYRDLKGNPIDIGSLSHDSEFEVRIRVTNQGDAIDNLALSYAIPSGWEIWNDRLHGGESVGRNGDYCDIRDDAYNCYFSLNKGESRTIRIRMRSAYKGNYLLPPTVCEDMYNPARGAATSSRRVAVTE